MARILIDTDELRHLAGAFESAGGSLAQAKGRTATGLGSTPLNWADPGLRAARVHERQVGLEHDLGRFQQEYESDARAFRVTAARLEASEGAGHAFPWLLDIDINTWLNGLAGPSALLGMAGLGGIVGHAMGAGALERLREAGLAALQQTRGLIEAGQGVMDGGLGLLARAGSGFSQAVAWLGDRLRILTTAAWAGIWDGLSDIFGRLRAQLDGLVVGLADAFGSIGERMVQPGGWIAPFPLLPGGWPHLPGGALPGWLLPGGLLPLLPVFPAPFPFPIPGLPRLPIPFPDIVLPDWPFRRPGPSPLPDPGIQGPRFEIPDDFEFPPAPAPTPPADPVSERRRHAVAAGLAEVGTSRPTGWNQPGECVKSVQRWIAAAGGELLGGHGVVGNYVASGFSEIDIADAGPGDVIQYTSTSQPEEWLNGVHTVMIVGRNADGTFHIIQSNSPYGSGLVTEVLNWTPRPPAGFRAAVWRMP